MKIFAVISFFFLSLYSFAMPSAGIYVQALSFCPGKIPGKAVDGMPEADLAKQAPSPCMGEFVTPDKFVDAIRGMPEAEAVPYANLDKVKEVIVGVGKLVYAERYTEALENGFRAFLQLFNKFRSAGSCENFAFSNAYKRVIWGVSDQPRSFRSVFEGCGWLAYNGDLKSLGYISNAFSCFCGDRAEAPIIAAEMPEISTSVK